MAEHSNSVRSSSGPEGGDSVRPFTLARLGIAVTLSLALSAACVNAGTPTFTDAQRTEVAAAVDSAVRAFRQAEVDRDPARAVAHLWPEFYMYADGVRSDYESVRENILATMANLRLFETEWTDVEVVPLASNSALSSFLFRDSIIAADGTLLHTQGPTTLVWERRGDEWRILYGDADHYPVNPDP